MKENTLDIIARLPELAQLSNKYIDYLTMKLYVQVGVVLFLTVVIVIIIYLAVKVPTKE